MTTQSEHVSEQVSPTKRRGRENALDMVRSLGLVLLLVGLTWWLAQPNDEDEREIRPVDSSGSVASLLREAPGTPVPTTPAEWTPTVDAAQPAGLRLGYVTPDDQYLEYAVSTIGDPAFLEQISGQAREVGTFEIGGVTWRQLVNDEDATTLVRTVGSATVVVGGVRETGTLEQLRTLAETVRP